MLIKVTQYHIDHGARVCCSSPVALAIMEAFGLDMEKADFCNLTVYNIIVHMKELHTSAGGIVPVQDTYAIPPKVKDWEDDYYHHKPVEPFEFELGPPIIPPTAVEIRLDNIERTLGSIKDILEAKREASVL